MPDNGAMPLNLKFIAKRRAELDLTFAAAAKRAGFPNRQKWYQYETGKATNPQLNTLEAMARALECRVADLLLDVSPARPRRKAK